MGLARHTYLKEWKRVRDYYGQKGQPAPVLHMATQTNTASLPTGAAAGAAIPNPATGKPEIYIPKSSLKKLGKFGTHADRNTLDHEWTHVFQKPELWMQGSGQEAERGAWRLSKAISRSNPQKRKRAYKHLSDWTKHGQFDPTYLQ